MLATLFRRKPKEPTRLRIGGQDREVMVAPGRTLLDAALEAGVRFPNICRSGACGTCKCTLTAGSVKEKVDTSYVLTADELQAGVILACQSVPKGDVALEVEGLDTHPELHPVRSVGATIETIEPLTEDIVEVTFAMDEPIGYRAGQCAELLFDDVAVARRYSFARGSRLQNVERASFCIRHVPAGEMSTHVHRCARPGDRARLRGPFGDFWLREGRNPLLFIAGGGGLAPIRAMLEDASADSLQRDARVYFGVRRQSDLYWLDTLEAIGRRWHGRFDVIPVLSEEDPASAWDGRRGRVVDAAVEDLHRSFPALPPAAYLCGPPPMVYAGLEKLQNAGVPVDQLFSDAFLDRRHAASVPRTA